MGSPFEPTALQRAENAIRDMFLGMQRRNENVSVFEMDKVLSSPRWIRFYGKVALKTAWNNLVKEGYVHKHGNEWVWGLD